MSQITEQPAEDGGGVGVIFDEHDPQGPGVAVAAHGILSGGRSNRRLLGAHRRQFDDERRAFAGTFALGADRAAVPIDQRLGDRQAQAHAAELPRDTGSPCSKASKMPAGLGAMPMPVSRTVTRTDASPFSPSTWRVRDVNLATLRRELCRVVQQVPEDLLQPRRIADDGAAVAAKVAVKANSLLANVRPQVSQTWRIRSLMSRRSNCQVQLAAW